MTRFKLDGDVDSALLRLNDAICEFERATGRRYLLMLIPENPDESILISMDGKPLPPGTDMTPEETLAFSMKVRRGESDGSG